MLGGPTSVRQASIVATTPVSCASIAALAVISAGGLTAGCWCAGLVIDRESFDMFFHNCEPAMAVLREKAAAYN